MLTTNIQSSYEKGVANLASQDGVDLLSTGVKEGDGAQGIPNVLQTTAQAFLNNSTLEHEVFGPSTLLISALDKSEMLAMARGLEGHLTGNLAGHGTRSSRLCRTRTDPGAQSRTINYQWLPDRGRSVPLDGTRRPFSRYHRQPDDISGYRSHHALYPAGVLPKIFLLSCCLTN